MGRPKLRLSDATGTPLKPVYLRYEILRGRSQDQSEGLDPGPDPGPDPGFQVPDPGFQVPDPRFIYNL